MEFLKYFLFYTVAIVLCNGNSVKLTFPQNEAEFLNEQKGFPVTHEKIIVPVDGFDEDSIKPENNVKPVHEDVNETNIRKALKHFEPLKDPESDKYIENAENVDNAENFSESSSARRLRRVVPNYPPPLYNYHHRHHPNSYSPRSTSEQQQQPLHVDTSNFKPTSPPKFHTKYPHPNGKYSAKLCHHHDNKNQHYTGKLNKQQHHVQAINPHLRLHNLPANVEDVPRYDWFDNTGKYQRHVKYGDAIHEPVDYAISRKSERLPSHAPQNSYKSSYRQPHASPPRAHVTYNNGDGLGNFLYKSEVYFPANKHHHHYASPPPPQVDHIHPIRTYNSPQPQPTFRPVTQPPGYDLRHHLPSPVPPTLATRLPSGKSIPRKNSKGPFHGSSKSEPQREEDEYDDNSGESDDDSDNDKYDGPPPGDEDDEDGGGDDSRAAADDDEEEDESAENTRQHRNRAEDEEESEEEEDYHRPDKRYNRQWKKFGLNDGDNDRADDERLDDENESGSFESSESRNVPQRIRFYHEVKEEFKTPSQQQLLNSQNQSANDDEEITTIEREVQPPPLAISPPAPKMRVKNVAMMMLNNSPQQQRTTTTKPIVSHDESSPRQNSDAARADSDLKFFQ